MKRLVILLNQQRLMNLPALVMALSIALISLSYSVSAQNKANDGLSVAESKALNNYHASKAAEKQAAATKYVLDYTEKTEGRNAPMTIALLQRYGNQLHNEGDIRKAISTLKTARKRGIVAFGEHGIQLFTINMDLGEAYVERNIGIGKPKKYFDYALEVLRENGRRETSLYVRTLVGTASWLAQAGALEGAFSAGIDVAANGQGNNLAGLILSGGTSLTQSYQSGYVVLKKYMSEAVELAEALELEDPYLSAEVAIVQAKLKVTETIFLEAVSVSIRGGISGITAQEYYQREDNHLLSAIDVLMADAGQNQDFLDIANSARMDIAWASKKMESLAKFCSSNTLNMASSYTPERLFEVADDGSVIAPAYSFRLSTNIFKPTPARKHDYWGPNQRSGKTPPHFVPVCINGRLMAALTNVPRVTIEEIRPSN
jgi:hypothetical protein